MPATPADPTDADAAAADPASAARASTDADAATEAASTGSTSAASASATSTDAHPASPAPIAPDAEVRRGWHRHPVARILARIGVALAGVLLGVLIGGHTNADIGPMRVSADLLLGPGKAELRIPPLGALEVDAYDGPFTLQMTVLTVDREKATAYINGSKSIDELTTAVENDVRATLSTLAIKTIVWAIVGGGIASLLVFRRIREGLLSVGTAVGLIAATGAVGYVTFDAKALQQPTYTGLLEQAPAIVGNVEDLASKFADYRKSLVKLVTNVSTLYSAVSTLPTDPGMADTIKVLHISDIHMNPAGFDLTANLVKQFKVDFVIDTGDLVDWGTPQESATFASIGALDVPYVYIRGNHDSKTTEAQVGQYPNVKVLDQAEVQVEGITIAGIGDARFSPDRTTYDDSALDVAAKKSAKEFAAYVEALPQKPDVLLFHDPGPASELADSGPLVLSGHTHKRAVKQVDSDTLLLVQGSTGGAGLRGLEGDDPTPLTASVLYFDATTHELRAWDDITVGGLGETDVSIARTLAPQAVQAAEESAASITPTSPSGSTATSGGPVTGPAPRTSEPTPQPTPTPTTTPGG